MSGMRLSFADKMAPLPMFVITHMYGERTIFRFISPTESTTFFFESTFEGPGLVDVITGVVSAMTGCLPVEPLASSEIMSWCSLVGVSSKLPCRDEVLEHTWDKGLLWLT
jgi:hypothetical protein